MKKTAFIFTILLGLFLTSCEKEANEPKNTVDEPQYEIIIEATANIVVATYELPSDINPNNNVALPLTIDGTTASAKMDFDSLYQTKIRIELETSNTELHVYIKKDGQSYKDKGGQLINGDKSTYWDVIID